LYQQTRLLLRQLKLDAISPTTIVGKLSAGQKQMVEIAKALAIRPSLLILDEPTASLTKQETDTLFEIIRHQKNAGVSIIYISHRMDEIRAIADEVSVLKDGMYQGTVDPKTTPTERIIQMMVGRELQQAGYHSNVQKEIRLQVKALSGKGFTNVDFNLYKGEILGVAGLLGSGRTELAQAIFGDVAIDSGAILKDGQEMKIGHPQQAIELGISYIPEERKSLGLFLDKSITENIVAARLQRGMYREKSNHLTAEALKQQLDIRTPSVRQQVRKLSGGNQQKVVLAKWLNTRPDVLIVNEPTHGVDVGAKAEIYQLLKKLTSEGKSILLISSELTELLLLSDRIAIMHNGSIRDVLTREQATEEKITALASGL
jgi:ribose transport system ATP-binding protein